jgi:hypothetical protein
MKPLIDLGEAEGKDIFNNQFINKINGQEVPTEYISAVEK